MRWKNPNKNKLFTGSNYPKSLRIYGQAKENMEKWSMIVHGLITVALPICIVMPLFMYSLFNYYNADDFENDDDIFIMILPFWYESYIYLFIFLLKFSSISIPFDLYMQNP